MIALKQGAELSLQELQKYCAKTLAKYKLPTVLKVFTMCVAILLLPARRSLHQFFCTVIVHAATQLPLALRPSFFSVAHSVPFWLPPTASA